ICEHAVVRTPSVQKRSLMPSGSPSSGPPSPFASRASAVRAMARARSGVSNTKALSARACSTAARCASTSSVAENSLRRSASRACAKVSEVSSVIRRSVRRSFHDLGHKKEMILPRRRVGQDVIGDAAVGHLVLAHLHRHGRDRRHRLDAFNVDLRELLDEGQNGIEFALKMLDLLVGHRDARQMRYAADSLGVNGHGGSLELKLAAAERPIAEAPFRANSPLL